MRQAHLRQSKFLSSCRKVLQGVLKSKNGARRNSCLCRGACDSLPTTLDGHSLSPALLENCSRHVGHHVLAARLLECGRLQPPALRIPARDCTLTSWLLSSWDEGDSMATRKECVEDTMVVLQLLAAEHPTFGIPREELAEVLGAPVVATDAAPEKTEKEEKTIEK